MTRHFARQRLTPLRVVEFLWAQRWTLVGMVLAVVLAWTLVLISLAQRDVDRLPRACDVTPRACAEMLERAR